MILQKATESSDDSPSSNAMVEMFFYLPLDMDLALHAAPAIALALDFFLFERKYSRKATRILAPFLALVYTVGYGWWVEHCSAKNNGICMCFALGTPFLCSVLFASPVSLPHRKPIRHSFGDVCRRRIDRAPVFLAAE